MSAGRCLAGWVLAACLLLPACAADLLVGAPARLPPTDAGHLQALRPLRISLGEVRDVPDMAAAVGRRGGAWARPGGAIRLTEDAGTILRRALAQTLTRAGHRVVERDADVHVAPRYGELTVAAPRADLGWDVVVRARVSVRVSTTPGAETWDEVSARAERTQQVAWRPGIGTVEPVLADCLRNLADLLAGRSELARALARHSQREPAS